MILNRHHFYPLTTADVNNRVADNKIGNYQFGEPTKDEWRVLYVGRSDTDLKQEILQQAELHHMLDVEGYEYRFSYADSVTEAYEQECRDYHKYRNNGYLLNERHPKKPVNNNHYHCPVESCPEHEDK